MKKVKVNLDNIDSNWWRNFLLNHRVGETFRNKSTAFDCISCVNEMLSAYNAVYNNGHLEFESEKDYAWFLLRWS